MADRAGAEIERPLRLKFDWSLVDERLLRSLLVEGYKAQPKSSKRDEQLRLVRSMGKREMERNARRVFGAGIPPKKMTTPVARLLLKSWLPRLSASELDGLATILIRRNRPSTKRETLSRLQSRVLDKTFRANLSRAFRKHHQSLQPTTKRNGGTRRSDIDTNLIGTGSDGRTPRVHQRDAHEAMTAALDNERHSMLVVMPTGAGKTFTAVHWLLARLYEEPESRVLWLTHRRELANQAARSFRDEAASLPQGFERKIRVVHSDAQPASVVASADNDVVVSTYQSIKTKHLRHLLKRPTYVVVDEAHHAGANQLNRLLDQVEEHTNLRCVVGLTATPYPTGGQAWLRFVRRFGDPAFVSDVAELTNSQILARMRVSQVDTGQRVHLDSAELRASANSGDLAPTTLRQLDNRSRNELVADLCKRHQEQFGPTLLFAVSIEHADQLTTRLVERGLDSRAVHTNSEASMSEVLTWFRSADSPVLVSVGMLTEGVDLPEARTAILARPTTSRILMQQMVGRVLRGPKSGGEACANVVMLKDHFTNFSDLLDPAEVLWGPHRFELEGGEATDGTELPELVDEDGNVIPLGVASRIGRIFDAPEAAPNLDDDDITNDRPIDLWLTFVPVVGYYELADALIPVFEHQVDSFERLGDAALTDGKLPTGLRFFDDGPPPFPSARSVREFVSNVRNYGAKPELRPLVADIGAVTVARQVIDRDLGPAAKAEFVHRYWSQHIDRELCSSRKFAETVDQRIHELLEEAQTKRVRLNGERMPPSGITSKQRKKLPHDQSRSLQPRFEVVQQFASEKLPSELRAMMTPGLDVGWSKRPSNSHLGYWTYSPTGRNKGRRRIRINCMFRTRRSIVTDEMLEYLLWHELLHDVLPGRGHDAEFRALEALFENAMELDAAWDTLGERFDLDASRYRHT